MRRLLISASLANLLSIQVWLFLFHSSHITPVTGAAYAGAIVAVSILTVLIWGASTLTEALVPDRWKGLIALLVLYVIWLLILWGFTKQSIQESAQYLASAISPWLITITAAILVAAGFCLLRRARRAVTVMTVAALVLSPYAAINTIQAAREAVTRGLSEAQSPPVDVPRLRHEERFTRTVVLLFDEFDYELAFESAVRRDPLPTLDILRLHSLFATRAYPPSHSTAMSLPAMLTGKLVIDGFASKAHPGDLELRFADGGTAMWSAQESLFSDMRARGLTSLRLNDALLPDFRAPGTADADIVVPPPPRHRLGVGGHAASHLVTVLTLLPFAQRAALDVRFAQLLGLPPPSDRTSAMVAQLVSLAGDARSKLLFIHILLPHLPVVFDTTSRRFGETVSRDYRDNLLAVDIVTERVMERLRERGRLADTTLVIVTDHFYRQKRGAYGLRDHRIPFIAMFPGDKEPLSSFEHPFNTVLFREMILSMVTGDIRTSAALGHWITTHATFAESPLTESRKGW